MCGRYANFTPVREFARLFGARTGMPDLAPRYNVAPSSPVLACRADPGGGRELVVLTWGLVPPWAKDPKTGHRMINARAETVAVKPAFRSALRRRRCLIAADGFYEWRAGMRHKQPYFIRMKGGRPFAFAGLWERWQGIEGEVIESCAIVVTQASKGVEIIHERMPVVVRPEDYSLWLDPALEDPPRVLRLLMPYPAEGMEALPVGLGVNRASNDGVDLIQPVTPAEDANVPSTSR
jgi:putative SOS response-associated peptidase YedK